MRLRKQIKQESIVRIFTSRLSSDGEAIDTYVEIAVKEGVGIHVVGLSDRATKTSLLRVSSALNTLGYALPGKQILINVSPSDLRKQDLAIDLPVAVGILSCLGVIPAEWIHDCMFLGTLRPDGSIVFDSNLDPYLKIAEQRKTLTCVLPACAIGEDAISVSNIVPVKNLKDVIRYFNK